MNEKQLMEMMVQVKRAGNLLHEVFDVSQQMAEVADRGDEVSLRMLLGMRAEPLSRLLETDRVLKLLVEQLPEREEREHYRGVLNGEGSDLPQDARLVEQCELNRRLYARVMEIDRRINLKLAREKSVYMEK